MIIKLPDYAKKIVQYEVIEKIFNHSHTSAWYSKVSSKVMKGSFGDSTKDYHRKIILSQGQADFTVGFEGLTADDKVLLYCYYYFQMHYSSSYAIFDHYGKILELGIWKACEGVLFIDIGCGPFTSGMAFLEYCNQQYSSYKDFRLYYAGIDISQNMLNKAKDFESNYSKNCTDEQVKFLKVIFRTSYRSMLDFEINEKIGIILNCCYLFASPTIDIDDFIAVLQEFRAKYPTNKICLIYQNAAGSSVVEHKYRTFLRKINILTSVETTIQILRFSFVDEFDSTKYGQPKFTVSHQLLTKLQ